MRDFLESLIRLLPLIIIYIAVGISAHKYGASQANKEHKVKKEAKAKPSPVNIYIRCEDHFYKQMYLKRFKEEFPDNVEVHYILATPVEIEKPKH